MHVENAIWFILIGIAAGFLAGLLMKGKGFGLVGNLIVGVLGAIIGGFAFSVLQISSRGLLGELAMATIGAVLLLFLMSKIRSP